MSSTTDGLVWTKDKPTVPGMYLYRPVVAGESASLVHVTQGRVDSGVFGCGDWAGPIPEPAEPPKPLPLPRRGRCKFKGSPAVCIDWGEVNHRRWRYYVCNKEHTVGMDVIDDSVTDIEWADGEQ